MLTKRSAAFGDENANETDEMEYNGVNSGDQTDIAELVNSFFTLRTLSQPIDVTEVDKTFEEFLSETDKLLFAKLNQHQHMFLRYYQHGNTKN